MLTSIAFSLHLLAASLWVGGMFFAYTALRPAASVLEPPQRLLLWQQVFARFFTWVWGFIVVILLTAYFLIKYRFMGFANVGIAVHIMHAIGWIMFFIYAYIFFIPYKKFNFCIAEGKLPDAAECLNTIRKGIALNLSLGIITILVASTHRI